MKARSAALGSSSGFIVPAMPAHPGSVPFPGVEIDSAKTELKHNKRNALAAHRKIQNAGIQAGRSACSPAVGVKAKRRNRPIQAKVSPGQKPAAARRSESSPAARAPPLASLSGVASAQGSQPLAGDAASGSGSNGKAVDGRMGVLKPVLALGVVALPHFHSSQLADKLVGGGAAPGPNCF